MGRVYAHRTYGSNNSFNTPLVLTNSWEIQLERIWNESMNHIPVGLHHDLVDIGEPVLTFFAGQTLLGTGSACNQDASACVIINDNVNGFTNTQMFSSLDANTTTYNQYRDSLVNNHLGSTTNTVMEVDDLFNSY